VRITAQLVDAAEGHHLWAERYDRELTDIFALQDEITASVTAALEPRLVAAEGVRAERRSADDLDAWDLVARGVSHFWKLTAVECDTGISILRQAVQRCPDYAPAHSMLAFTLVIAAYVGLGPAGGERGFASQLVHRAVELDEEDPWAHAALGYLAFTSRRTEDAIRHLRTALDLNPNFAAAYGALGWTFVFDGQSEHALGYFEQALRMSPQDPLNAFILAGIAAAHYFAARYPEAATWARKAVELRPGLLGGHRVLCGFCRRSAAALAAECFADLGSGECSVHGPTHGPIPGRIAEGRAAGLKWKLLRAWLFPALSALPDRDGGSSPRHGPRSIWSDMIIYGRISSRVGSWGTQP
jgi:adenylate cyclase